jgi:hypothetical protein
MRDQLSSEELEVLALSTEEQRSINGGAALPPITIPGFPGPTDPWPFPFPGGTGPTFPNPPLPEPWLL